MSGPYFINHLPQPLPSLLTFHLLEQFAEIRHGISTRQSERHQHYDVAAEQVHGTDFYWVRGKHQSQTRPKADAILVSAPNMTVRIGTSDCVPMIVYDPTTRHGGVIHAGYKGTTQGILLNVLSQFRPRQVYIGIGPAIGPECYDQIDLPLENMLQAKQAGVPLDHIEVMRFCTKCHTDVFFSYRAGDHHNFGTYFRLKR